MYSFLGTACRPDANEGGLHAVRSGCRAKNKCLQISFLGHEAFRFDLNPFDTKGAPDTKGEGCGRGWVSECVLLHNAHNEAHSDNEHNHINRSANQLQVRQLSSCSLEYNRSMFFKID